MAASALVGWLIRLKRGWFFIVRAKRCVVARGRGARGARPSAARSLGEASRARRGHTARVAGRCPVSVEVSGSLPNFPFPLFVTDTGPGRAVTRSLLVSDLLLWAHT